MNGKPGRDIRLRRISQKLAIAAVLVVLVVGVASAQWGGWWGNSSGGGGGWWSNQQPPRRARPQRRAAPQQYYPQQSYQQQYYPYYQPGQQPTAKQPRTTTRQRTRSRRRPPVVAYAPEDDRETRRSRSRARRGDKSDDPSGSGDRVRAGGYGVTYCVRLCDGRFFPLSEPGRMKPEEMCSALCPASPTKVFSGGTIDDSSARDGSRYEKLKNAFLYRKKLVEGCTCNGKNGLGLARIDLKTDPTLEAGDIVVMTDGLNVYSESRTRQRRGRRPKITTHFTPIKKSSLVSRSFRRTLDRIEIAKTRPRLKSQQEAQQVKPDEPDLTD